MRGKAGLPRMSLAGRDEQARVRKEPTCCARRPGIRRP